MTPLDLIAERAPALDKITRERDPRADDEAFYTGLGAALLRSLERELALMRSERAAYDYVNGVTR